MKILDFEFKKISAEKINNFIQEPKIESNIDIFEIKKIDSKNKDKEEILEISFSYQLIYSPKLAEIELKGRIILKEDEKIIKEILNQWKNKKIPEQIKIILFNLILTKSSIKSLELEDELKIPYHISLPKLKVDRK